MIRIPARLTYNPKAYVYTKDQSGTVYNLTPWVTAGQVHRLLNQVSSAEITLRNPYRRFTTPPVAFHPMDPITIYLERIAGYPIRVFTGYLDTTPYYQLYPGTITLQASCTLKRLLYTWFDPSLPYVISFFGKYGWINTGSGSIINPNAIGGPTNLDTAHLQDASFGKLLWATLFEIGEWQDTNIYVENLPNGIAQRIQQLMASMQAGLQTAANDFTTFLNNVIGAGSQGTGANSGAQGSGPIWQVKASSELNNSGPVAQQTTGNWTSASDKLAGAPASHWGNAGWTELSAPPSSQNFASLGVTYPRGTLMKITAGNKSVVLPKSDNGAGSTGFNAAIGLTQDAQTQLGLSGGEFNVTIQLVNGGNLTVAAGFGTQVGNSVGAAVTQAGNSTVGAAVTQAGKGAQGLTNNSNGVTNPIPGWTISTYDAGVDADPPKAGASVLAPADCTFVSRTPGWFPYLYLFKFTPPLTQGSPPSQYWYVAEGINPTFDATKGGATFKQGASVATAMGPGAGNGTSGSIEIGWGDPNTNSQTLSNNTATHNQAGTPFGTSFKNFFSIGGGSPVFGTGVGGTSTAGTTTSTNTAQAFVAELQFPSVEDQVTAIALGAEHKGLMHDQQLMPFVQQLAQSSLRTFQSLPNGDFYAFYPDYFGEFGHRAPYWLIDDIEVLDGGVSLSDDSLATHVFAVGDNTWPVNQELLNMLFSAGTINVFNAFLTPGRIDTKKNPFKDGRIDGHKATGMQSVMDTNEAVDFIKRYGARPLVQNYPMVHSNIFEMLLAYQQFMYAWSNQFKSPFTFTFMPELYPGGKVGFPNHGLQMYIESVTHTWDYAEGGFTTTAELTAPSLLVLPDGSTVNPGDFPELPPNMVKALVEPIHNASQPSSATQQTTTIFHNLADSLAQFHQSNQNR